MFQELEEILGFESSTSEQPHLVVVSRDCRSDAGFVLHYALASQLKRDRPVVLVNVAQARGHYRNVAAKSGTDPKKCGDLLACIDCLERGPADPRALYAEIVRCVGERPSLLLVDDLTLFLSLGWSLAETIAFVHYCCKANDGRVLFGAYEPESYDPEARQLLAFLRHSADASIRLRGLATGYSKDVHGEMGIVERSGGKKQQGGRRFQYKLEEKKVCIFPAGMSMAVL